MASETNQPGIIDTTQPAGRLAEPDVHQAPPVEPSPAFVEADTPRAASDYTVSCKFCRRTTEVCRSRLRNVFEWSIAILFVPYRCLYCGYRGFALRFQVPKTPANQEILREVDPGHRHKRKPPVSAA